MDVTYRRDTVYFSCLFSNLQVFLMQVIGLSSTGIDNWGHVSVGVYHPWIFLVPLNFSFY